MTSTNGSRTRQLIETAARENGWEIEEYTQSVYAKRGDRVVNVIFTQAGGVNWAAAGTPVTGGHVAAGPDNPVFRGTGKCEQVLEYLRTHGSTDDADVLGGKQASGNELHDLSTEHRSGECGCPAEIVDSGTPNPRPAGWQDDPRDSMAEERPAAVVTNVSGLSPTMRAGLVDRYRVPAETARALFRRGLVTTGRKWAVGGFEVELTEGGERARDAVLAPFTPGARVRNIRTALVGRVVRLERGERCDVVVLRWDTWKTDTAGSPAYLEVVANDVETGTDDVAFAECESSDEQRRRAAGVYVPLIGTAVPNDLVAADGYLPLPGEASAVRVPRIRPCASYEPHAPHDWHELNLMWACPGESIVVKQATMPTATDYNGVKPTEHGPDYAYGFLRAAVLGQAAGRPFSDPAAAVRHLDECLRLAGYSVPTMEG